VGAVVAAAEVGGKGVPRSGSAAIFFSSNPSPFPSLVMAEGYMVARTSLFPYSGPFPREEKDRDIRRSFSRIS